ncbi:DUF4133 domain-containing protein [Pedobacter paludis]|uniref:DUF4133 domain-containing protein n=2 Tax=Pedobacter paludis TaxID=2203212 RepID=A0A317F1Z1_9SPHI|nr:DUF4133 domain-containing protein [Pedobacter paludis]
MLSFSIYKGLDMPLVYRGFKGKFIYYGIGSLGASLVFGGLSGAIFGMYAGGFVSVLGVVGGLFYTFQKQKNGLHNKTRNQGIYIHPVRLKISIFHAKTKENSI